MEGRLIYNEKNIPAKQNQAFEKAWFFTSDVYQGRTADHQPQTAKGAQTPVRLTIRSSEKFCGKGKERALTVFDTAITVWQRRNDYRWKTLHTPRLYD